MLRPARILIRARGAIVAGAMLGMLSGCGGAANRGQSTANSVGEAASAAAHFTHQQELVEQGGRLFVSDGCTGCHSLDRSSRLGPSFGHLAGSRVTLADGRRALVDERFLKAALTDPGANYLRGLSARADDRRRQAREAFRTPSGRRGAGSVHRADRPRKRLIARRGRQCPGPHAADQGLDERAGGTLAGCGSYSSAP